MGALWGTIAYKIVERKVDRKTLQRTLKSDDGNDKTQEIYRRVIDSVSETKRNP